MVVVMMVTMGRDDDDARCGMMVVMMVMMMAHLDFDLGELELVGRRVGKPCVIGL